MKNPRQRAGIFCVGLKIPSFTRNGREYFVILSEAEESCGESFEISPAFWIVGGLLGNERWDGTIKRVGYGPEQLKLLSGYLAVMLNALYQCLEQGRFLQWAQ